MNPLEPESHRPPSACSALSEIQQTAFAPRSSHDGHHQPLTSSKPRVPLRTHNDSRFLPDAHRGRRCIGVADAEDDGMEPHGLEVLALDASSATDLSARRNRRFGPTRKCRNGRVEAHRRSATASISRGGGRAIFAQTPHPRDRRSVNRMPAKLKQRSQHVHIETSFAEDKRSNYW